MSRKNIFTQTKKKKALALLQANRLDEARAAYLQIVTLDKMDAEAWFMLGIVQGKLDETDDAIASLRQSLKLNPSNALAFYNLGTALRNQGKLDEAIRALQESVHLGPEQLHAHAALSDSLCSADRLEEAVVSFRNLVRLNPSDFEALARLGRVFHLLGNLKEAAACYRKVLQLRPDWAATHDNLGHILREQGLVDESIASQRRAIEITPNDIGAHSNFLLTMQYLAEPDAAEIFAEHRRWADMHEETPVLHEWHNVRDPERRLRVGYVSADFRMHSVPFFFEPLLANHDRSAIEPFCYAAVPIPDAVTARLQASSSGWKNITGLTATQVAEMIRADGIDILVDLAGHTGNNALKVFTFKPVPVQVTYLGYPDTTGLSTIDYRLTDTLSDPLGVEPFFTESLVRLPGCFLCYKPLAEAPEVALLPALEKGYVTFGSFNHLPKLNTKVIALWVEVLRAVPNSCLFIKSLPLADVAARDRYYGLFEAEGIGRDRVELIGHTATQAEHLDLYKRLDIALDTFPYNGTTTTCEALWMGVPVVTLAGERHSGRVGVSLLNAVGHPEWIARTPEQYLAIAQKLARDIQGLTSIRSNLRGRMLSSPLCDGASFARKVEVAYREMWRAYCASKLKNENETVV